MGLPTPDILRRYSLFGGLVDTQLNHLIERIRVDAFAAGTIIVRQGEKGDRLWCVAEGTVEVQRGVAGAPVVIARLGPGETIGEMELIDMQPRSGTVVALTDCTLYGLALRDILALQREDLPSFTLVIMNLARDLSRRLRRMDATAAGERGIADRVSGGTPPA
ncbi:MAG TPA: cyclic nucleotide-binding domain-containing protein [Planctomycetes bacterium]|nr:cyclic nucleotide-binding domain-containing protein [Planctomycetota bacterium]